MNGPPSPAQLGLVHSKDHGDEDIENREDHTETEGRQNPDYIEAEKDENGFVESSKNIKQKAKKEVQYEDIICHHGEEIPEEVVFAVSTIRSFADC